MANKEHLKILQQGAAVWNEWREKNRNLEYPDLRGANLFGARGRTSVGRISAMQTSVGRN
jgi:hypothetical protein